MNNLIINEFDKVLNLIKIENKLIIDTKINYINQFRIKNLKKVINIIKNLNFEINSVEQIKSIKGIGKKSIDRINEILKKGYLKEVKNYDKIINKNDNKIKIIDELVRIIGIGYKIANELVNNYKIKSIEDLKNKINLNKIKVNEKILLGLKYLGKFEGKIPRKEITEINKYLNDLLNKFNNQMFITICGSYRRELDYSSDIDVLLCHLDIIYMSDIYASNSLLKELIQYLHNKKFIIDDLTDKNYKTKYMGFCKLFDKIRRIDIRFIPIESYFTALMYFTGSANFNENIRNIAKKKGYKLNEYELVNINDNKKELILSEFDIFNFLNLKYIEPKNRI